MPNNKQGIDSDFKISSGQVPRTPSRAGEGFPSTPQDCGRERNPEFEYPPTGKLPPGPTGKD